MSDFSYNILFREKQLRDERLKNARAQEWDKLGCCTACGGKIGWFLKALRGDLCSNCQYNQHKQLKREEEEERKTYFEKQFYLEKKRNIPTDLTSKRLECYIEDLINEKSTVAALAFWKDESSGAEKLFSGLAANLLTGGIAGYQETISFGVVALTDTKLWRIEMGYSHPDFLFYSKIEKSKNIISLSLKNIESNLELGENICKLNLKSVWGDDLVISTSLAKATLKELQLLFPETDSKWHPVFEYFPRNKMNGIDIGQIISARTKNTSSELKSVKEEYAACSNCNQIVPSDAPRMNGELVCPYCGAKQVVSE